jgi:hypothetical protein
VPVLVASEPVSELRPSASAGSMEVEERELSSAQWLAVPRLVLQEVKSEQRFEAESPRWAEPVSAEPVFGP